MEDRISNLPDALICHILSFLPTKQAVATSVLSKLWMPLWRSVPAFDFNDFNLNFTRSKESYARFVQSVHTVILSRDQHQPIEKFRLICLSECVDMTNVNIWLNAVVQRRVQHLDISLEFGVLNPIISSVIFTCTTLVVLELRSIVLEPLSSSVVDLPLLKVLQLEFVFFSNCGCLTKLLSGCPVLEKFKAGYLQFGSDVTEKEFITSPKLVRANIATLHNPFLMKVAKNVEFLYLDLFVSKPYVPMFHNLTRLELFYRHYLNHWYQVVELLKYCPKLQVLLINQSHYQLCDEVGEREWQYPPSVPECILLHLKICYLNDYRGTKDD